MSKVKRKEKEESDFLKPKETNVQRGKYTLFSEFRDFNNTNPKGIKNGFRKIYQEAAARKSQSQEINFHERKRMCEVDKLEDFLKYHPQCNKGVPQGKFISNAYIMGKTNTCGAKSYNTLNSYYFQGPERFDNQNKYQQKTGFTNTYNKLNHLISENQGNTDVSKQLIQNNYELPKSDQCPIINLQTYINQQGSSSPQKKRNDLQQLQEEIKIRKEWGQKYNDIMKRKFILEKTHQSGVLSVDSPENMHTIMYQNQYGQLNNEKQRKLINSEKRHQNLQQNRNTNLDIEFFNSNSKNYRIRSLTSNNGVQIFQNDLYTKRQEPEWTMPKKTCTGQFMEKFQNSKVIFTPSSQYIPNQERIDSLAFQDNRKRGYNIISFVK